MRKHAAATLVLPLLALLLAACGAGDSTTGEQATGRITGTVSYRERMMLPPGATLEVQLQDISRPDAMAAAVESVRVELQGGPPYPFAIDYDAGSIDPRKSYALGATIAVDGQLMFTTTEYVNPFAGPPLEVLVHRVAEPDRLAR